MNKKIVWLMALFTFALCPAAQAEEDMRFVDADGGTGYYLDVSALSVGQEGNPAETVFTARIAVVKADYNKRYLYQMRFNPQKGTYEILNSEVQAYDTRAVLERSTLAREPRHYGLSSPMHSIVSFIYEWQAEQNKAAAKSY